jgi:hypothetical protein
MPLRDHFHSPINDRHRWDAVHGLWPGMMVRELFDRLPPGFQAEPQVHLGSGGEVDIGTFEENASQTPRWEHPESETQASPTPTLVLETALSEQDEYQIRIYDEDRDRRLVATIELLSPSNKDRPASRELFLSKVTTLLQQNVAVTLVDLVTSRPANLYAQWLESMERSDPALGESPPSIYVATMRAQKQVDRPRRVEAWFVALTLGQPLPTIPLWLGANQSVAYDLEPSYEETCRLLRIR